MADPTTIDDAPYPSEAEERFLDAVLSHALRPAPDQRDRRIANAMAAINASEPPTPARFRQASYSLGTRLAIAALVLIVLGVLWPRDDGNAAFAKVMRSVQAAEASGARHYRVIGVLRGPLGGEKANRADLYVDGRKRFATRSPTPLPAGDVWFGCNGDDYWIAPPIGPPRVGDRSMLRRWITTDLNPNAETLQLSTLLKQLAEDYELSSLEDEVLADPIEPGREVLCQRVRGVRRQALAGRPAQIDVWADQESGVARRVLLDWGLAEGGIGRVSTQLELVDEPELPDDWFDVEGH